MNVFDGDGRFVDQHADGKGQAAQRHDVDRVVGQPQPQQRGQEGHRDVEDHHDHTAPVVQEEKDHETRQRGADQPFDAHAADGLDHRGRLVELVTDLHPLGQHALERRHGAADVGHDGQGRSGVFLDDGNVNGAMAVHQRVAEVDVGAVCYLGHILNVDVATRLHGNLADLLWVDDHGIGRHDRHLVLDVQVAGRDDDVARRQRLDDIFRRHVIRT